MQKSLNKSSSAICPLTSVVRYFYLESLRVIYPPCEAVCNIPSMKLIYHITSRRL